VLASELEDHWYILRRREMKDRLSNVFGDFEFGQRAALVQMGKGPKLSQALETYLSLKSAGRPKTFEGGARRSVGYLMEVTDDKPIDAHQRSDANAFREYLRSRSLSSESIARTISNVRAIINFVSKEEGLQPSQAFSGVYLGEPTKKVTRYVPDAKELKKLQRLCRSCDDEMRWLLALISDTGLRLSEALGLSKDEVFLETSTPYIVIEPKPWRSLKTADS
jgi:site-specific recombinase XerD